MTTSRAMRCRGAMSPALARAAACSHCWWAGGRAAVAAGSQGAHSGSASWVASGVRQARHRHGTCLQHALPMKASLRMQQAAANAGGVDIAHPPPCMHATGGTWTGSRQHALFMPAGSHGRGGVDPAAPHPSFNGTGRDALAAGQYLRKLPSSTLLGTRSDCHTHPGPCNLHMRSCRLDDAGLKIAKLCAAGQSPVQRAADSPLEVEIMTHEWRQQSRAWSRTSGDQRIGQKALEQADL